MTKIPDGEYAVRLVEIIGHNLLVAKITSSVAKGERLLLKMPLFHVKVTGDRADIVLGTKPYALTKRTQSS